jgi:hypothetical protein
VGSRGCRGLGGGRLLARQGLGGKDIRRAGTRELLQPAQRGRDQQGDGQRVPGSQSPSEAQCTSIPTAGNDVSFKMYWNNEYCIDGKPVDKKCLDSQSNGFAVNKQSAGNVQNVPGLGDQAFCFVAPPATVDVLKGWIYLIVGADSCVHAQTLAGMLLAKVSA